MNDTERYFALLEAWLFCADAEVLGGAERRNTDQFSDNMLFLTRLKSSEWQAFDEYCHIYNFQGAVSTWNTWLQAQFGLIEVQAWPAAGRKGTNRGWIMAAARRTRWGDAVAGAVVEATTQVKGQRPAFFGIAPPEDGGFGLIRFLFDYGDSWQFKLQLERRESGQGRRPKLIGSAGRAPKQYPDWD